MFFFLKLIIINNNKYLITIMTTTTISPMPLFYKINTTTTMNNFPLIIYDNLDINDNDNDIFNNQIIALLVVNLMTLILILFLSLENNNKKLKEKIIYLENKNKNDNKKLKEKIIKIKRKCKYLENENDKLKDKNYHQIAGVRKSLRIINNEIIEEITDDEIETDNLTDSIKEIYKLYPGMRFDDERMHKYIKKHPKLKNSRSKTPVRTMNSYLQKLRQKRFLKRELVEGKFYYSE